MKKLYIRTTHDFDNISREWVFRKIFRNIKIETKTPLGVHALDSHRWMTFEEILENNRISSKEHYPCSKEDLEHDLALLARHNMIKSKL